MQQLPLIDDYRSLFLNETPLIDVRAPVEYSQGAFPNAVNLPLINDEERHAIGIRYAELGQDDAIKLGHELVQGEIKEKRISHWADFIQKHPGGALYCFRGGMRSKISQQWLYERTGIAYPRIAGGYKALRRFLINELETTANTLQAVVVGGRTGVGKTELLQRLDMKIDLEGIYHHRGSSFGYRAMPQPAQIDIENRLAITLIKHQANGIKNLALEDEASNIGSRSVPAGIMHHLRTAPLVLIEANVEERVNAVFDEYINVALTEFQTIHGAETGFKLWSENLIAAMERIRRRLGPQRHDTLIHVLHDAIYQQRHDNNADHHKHWIQTLLVEYYDPMYDYQLSKKMDRVTYRGNQQAVLDYLSTQHAIR